MKGDLEQVHWHHISGKEFGDAFYILIGKFEASTGFWREQIERPSYYCAGLAIEHFLKGYLLLNNIEHDRRSHSGHNLDHLIALGGDRLKKFFQLKDEDIEYIKILNQRYYKHEDYGNDELRYASLAGLRISPHPENLNKIIKRMCEKLKQELKSQKK